MEKVITVTAIIEQWLHTLKKELQPLLLVYFIGCLRYSLNAEAKFVMASRHNFTVKIGIARWILAGNKGRYGPQRKYTKSAFTFHPFVLAGRGMGISGTEGGKAGGRKQMRRKMSEDKRAIYFFIPYFLSTFVVC